MVQKNFLFHIIKSEKVEASVVRAWERLGGNQERQGHFFQIFYFNLPYSIYEHKLDSVLALNLHCKHIKK